MPEDDDAPAISSGETVLPGDGDWGERGADWFSTQTVELTEPPQTPASGLGTSSVTNSDTGATTSDNDSN
jgi:hypothetical protein